MANPTYWLYQCTGTRGSATVPLGTAQYPTCSAGGGSWQQIEVQPSIEWDPALLNYPQLGSAYSAGFTVMCMSLAIGWAAKQILKAIRMTL